MLVPLYRLKNNNNNNNLGLGKFSKVTQVVINRIRIQSQVCLTTKPTFAIMPHFFSLKD